MDFTPEQRALQDTVRAFCAEHCPVPGASRGPQQPPEYPAALHTALGHAGLMAHCLPQPFGAGGTPVDLCIINEVLGAHSADATNILFVNGICAALMALAGPTDTTQPWITGIAKGTTRFAFGMTEPGAGSDAAAMATTATREGDTYTLNGQKTYTTGAADADFILTAARTQPDGKASRGTSLIAVPTDSDGLTITPMDKIAGNNVASCDVVLDNVRVPADHRVGGEHQGWAILMMGGALERLSVAASAVGGAQAIFDETLEHVSQREQFGQPVGQFQAVQHQLADMATTIEAMRLLTYSAAEKVAAGGQPLREISMAKLFASEGANEIAMRGMRLLGGKAYLNSTPMPTRQREAMLALYAGGTPEIQRNLIARTLTPGR